MGDPMFDDDEEREMREAFGGLWLAGCVLALCGLAYVLDVCQRIARRLRG